MTVLPMFAESGGKTWYVSGEGDPVEAWLVLLPEEAVAEGDTRFPALAAIGVPQDGGGR